MFDTKKYYIENRERKKKYYVENRERKKKYYVENRERILERGKKYRKDNPEKIKERGRRDRKRHSERMEAYRKKYYIENREMILERSKKYKKAEREKARAWAGKYFENKAKKKYIASLKLGTTNKIARAIRSSLKNIKSSRISEGNRSWEKKVGYTLNELFKRLEKTIPGGYTWIDFLNGELHIDHRIPISAFNFTKVEHTDFKRCWALKNLRLLPARENWSKHNKIDKPFQLGLKLLEK